MSIVVITRHHVRYDELGGLVLKRMNESQLGGRHATVGQCVCMTWDVTLLQ